MNTSLTNTGAHPAVSMRSRSRARPAWPSTTVANASRDPLPATKAADHRAEVLNAGAIVAVKGLAAITGLRMPECIAGNPLRAGSSARIRPFSYGPKHREFP